MCIFLGFIKKMFCIFNGSHVVTGKMQQIKVISRDKAKTFSVTN